MNHLLNDMRVIEGLKDLYFLVRGLLELRLQVGQLNFLHHIDLIVTE